MITTTLCYIEKDGKYLMLHRVKKHNDINEGKWIGVGGHAENQETPEECLVREVKEETGLTLTSYRFRGCTMMMMPKWSTFSSTRQMALQVSLLNVMTENWLGLIKKKFPSFRHGRVTGYFLTFFFRERRDFSR